MSGYQCPICEAKIPRDAALFLDHGQKHVIESIQKAHPEWAKDDGVCAKCVDYFQKVLHGEPFQDQPSCVAKK